MQAAGTPQRRPALCRVGQAQGATPAGRMLVFRMSDSSFLETREHQLRKLRLVMTDGNLTTNALSSERGVSARAWRKGYWGFASAPLVQADGAATRSRVQQQALAHATTMSRFGPRRQAPPAGARWRGEQGSTSPIRLAAREVGERLRAIDAWCRRRFTGLVAVNLLATEESHDKQLQSDQGVAARLGIERAALAIEFIGQADDGAPIQVREVLSARGGLGDLAWQPSLLEPLLDTLHGHLQAKRHAVPARGGEHTVVLAPDLAGMLAHEAMGHPCEADCVLAGAVTATRVGQPVASELVTMADLAHHWNGQELMVPVYADDEGTPAEDVVMIDRGRLAGFMHSRETAALMGQAPTGNARAYGPHDEPLVRMRNTVILPGDSTLEQMIEGVDDGYLLLRTSNGEADTTTEFMFGVSLGYEIRGGRVGRAIRDTTLSGNAMAVLASVDAVGSEMHWDCAGYCGKKQPMIVSVGGPALRARAHLGGE